MLHLKTNICLIGLMNKDDLIRALESQLKFQYPKINA